MAEGNGNVPSVEEQSKNAAEFFQQTTGQPEWLTKDYLEKVFRECENDPNLLMSECEIVLATKVGDNFASVVYRGTVAYTTKNKTINKSIIIKVKPFAEGFRKDFMSDVPLFRTETDMYTRVLPEMQRLLEKLGDTDILTPKMIYSNADPDIIILEDIAQQGYVMRHQTLHLDNTKKVVLKLAKFHALSYYMYHEEKKELDDFKFGLITTATMQSMEFFAEGFKRAVECAKEWDGYAEIAAQMEKFAPHLLRKIREVYIVDKSEKAFNVLNHGDFHLKNLLFINNGDDIEKISFIDFQISVWATPAIDLNYVLYCNASAETRDNHRGELIRLYHSTFCTILEELGCLKTPPSLLDLNIEMMKYGKIEIILACQFMAMFFMNFESIPKEYLENIDLLSRWMYMESGMRPILEKAFVDFYHKGYFEI